MNGLLDIVVMKGTVDGDQFYDYIQKHLLPHLMPFNGVNPHSVVVLDNCSIHHVQGIASMIEDVGALVHFLPPYSPDFNPIEETFSKVKAEMKNLEASMADVADIETIVYCAFATVTPEDCKGWIMNRLVPIMLEILSIILFFYSQVIAYYSLDTCLLFFFSRQLFHD